MSPARTGHSHTTPGDEPRHQDISLALSHSLGFGGHNTVLAFRAA